MRYLFFILILIFVRATDMQAASLSVVAPDESTIGQQISVDIVADTDGQSINSVEANIKYPNDVLGFVGYQDASGIVKLWVSAPSVKKEGVVHFSGGVPGGVDGVYSSSGKSSSITIVRLLFDVKNSGTAAINIIDSTLLLNDGKATELSHSEGRAKIAIVDSTGATTTPPMINTDSTPPLPFALIVIPENEEGRSPAMVAFSAYDQDSGIASYKIKIGYFSTWKEAASPYPLPSKLFPYTVKASAIDGFGNVRISSVHIDGLIPGWSIIVVLAIIIAGCVRYFMVKKKV